MSGSILVFIGGGLGALLRYLLSLYVNRLLKTNYMGTFIANILGCLFLGFVSTIFLNVFHSFDSNLKLFLTTGLAGGFTTFSTFSSENLNLIKEKKFLKSLIYVLSSIIFGLLAVYCGYSLAILF